TVIDASSIAGVGDAPRVREAFAHEALTRPATATATVTSEGSSLVFASGAAATAPPFPHAMTARVLDALRPTWRRLLLPGIGGALFFFGLVGLLVATFTEHASLVPIARAVV